MQIIYNYSAVLFIRLLTKTANYIFLITPYFCRLKQALYE